ncbi:sigma-70 family RNA polymerase sigma factor [Larkinella knui]|uniref:Sigma-70 family RNA polymerase sigma factor n=1 Tax=Larkinella knui TaxID=2025310 RepID=A0A3P1CP53_9BACT|nr:sigma-70 family RNA polymerase sigma factor [Larkinella knui]RRB15029.1 sigma-70 family RNA polymerase sigma factor [Larkinella knui]
MNTRPDSTNDLIRWNAFREGSESAFAALYSAHYRHLMNYGRRFGADVATAEDAIHDVFIDLWNYRRTLTQPQSVQSYLLRSFRNRLVNQLAERQRRFAETDVGELFGLLSPEPSAEERLVEDGLNQEQQEQVQAAFATLSPRQQEVLYLRYFTDLGYDEICAVMGITYNTARTQLYQALTALRKRLQPNWPVLLLLIGLFEK